MASKNHKRRLGLRKMDPGLFITFLVKSIQEMVFAEKKLALREGGGRRGAQIFCRAPGGF